MTAPGAQLSNLQVVFEQNGKQTPLVSLAQPASGEIKQEGADRVRVTKTIGRDAIPDLKSGPAKILVTAERAGDVRHAQGAVVRLARRAGAPREAGRSRCSRPSTTSTSADPRWSCIAPRPPTSSRACRSATSSIRATRRRGAKLEGVKISDPAVKIAFIALRYDQDVNTPMYAYARDEAGNAARADFDRMTFPEAVQEEPDRARRYVPQPRRPGDPRDDDRGESAGTTPREVPGHQRRAAPEERREDRELDAPQSAPEILWGGAVFHPFTQHRGRSGVRGPADLRLRRQGSRPADAPRLRSRARRALADPRRQPRQGRRTRRRSASTATA